MTARRIPRISPHRAGCRCPECHAVREQLARPWQFHEPSVHRIEEHRAFGEELCPDCRAYLSAFEG